MGRRPGDRRRVRLVSVVAALVFALSPLPCALPLAGEQRSARKAFAAANYEPAVFIAVGTAPQNHKLRQVLRHTWLSACRAHPKCEYRFFTERPPAPLLNTTSAAAECVRAATAS